MLDILAGDSSVAVDLRWAEARVVKEGVEGRSDRDSLLLVQETFELSTNLFANSKDWRSFVLLGHGRVGKDLTIDSSANLNG